jgi:hypothetical protein
VRRRFADRGITHVVSVCEFAPAPHIRSPTGALKKRQVKVQDAYSEDLKRHLDGAAC